MRQLAVLPNADAARTLADRLQALRIETRLDQAADGWAVWVFDEDRLPEARKELADFTANPADPRFTGARREAEQERRRARQAEEEAPPVVRPPPAWAPRPPYVTHALVFLSCVVFVLHTGFLIQANGGLASGEVFDILVWGHAEGQAVFTSPTQQALSISQFERANAHEVRWPFLDDILHRGQVWRLVTPIFLHFGLIHLLFNMMMLRPMGAVIELRRGVWRYLLLVLVCAVGSNLAQYFFPLGVGRDFFRPNPLFGGMSGVLYALFGYIWMKARYQPEMGLWLSPRLVFWMLAWLFLCMSGALGSIANTAHLAGLALGVVIGAAPTLWRRARGPRPT